MCICNQFPARNSSHGLCSGRPPRQQPRSCYPASLTPTPLQLPRMRDNWLLAIYVQERLAEEDEVRLWDDLGEQTAAQLEANLTNLESKLDAMLAAFEQQGGQGPGQGSAGDKTSSNSNGGSNSSSST
ncbi:hypothetical protein MY1884_003814 [Beauveria asiatica]